MLRSENEEIFGARVLGCSWRMLISVGRQGVGFGLLLSFTTPPLKTIPVPVVMDMIVAVVAMVVILFVEPNPFPL